MNLSEQIKQTKRDLKKAKERTQRLHDELFLLILEAQKKGHKAP